MSFLEAIIITAISAIAGPIIVNAIARRAASSDSVNYGAEVGMRTCDGKYVQTNLDRASELFALARHVKDWEIFEIVSSSAPFSIAVNRPVRYGDKVAFRAKINSNFVGADLDGEEKKLTAIVPHVKGWEKFTLSHPSDFLKNFRAAKVRYGDPFSLTASNGKYIYYARDTDGRLSATAPHKKEWETFIFISPPWPK